ncbi:hypothetical protein ABPG77_001718 [Micractinium sp. CCAP 211/92]
MSMARPALATAGPGASLEHLRDLVESAIESHDVGPLVKAVFEVEAGEAGAGAVLTPPLPAPPTRADGAESATTRDSDAVPAGGVLERVLELLGEVADDKEAEIAQICRSNAAEIAGAMHELGAMQQQAADLRRQLLASNAALQAAGTSFAGRLEEVQEASALQQSMAEARQAVGSALQVLQLCARAAQLIEGKQLYKAYKVLEAIQRDHGPLLQGDSGYSSASRLPAGSTAWPSASVSSEAGSREGTPHKASNPAAAAGTPTAGTPGAMGPAQRAGSGGSGAQLGALAAFLRERVAGLTAALEQRAIADFHNWLTSVRAQARVVGLRAVRRAALERQQEEQLARQRKLLLPRLEGLADVRAAGQLGAQSLQAPGVAQPAPPTPLEAPHAVGTPAAAAAAKLSPLRGVGSPGADSPTAAHAASFRAARQTASSPTRAAATAANGAAGSPAGSPRSAASASRAAAAQTGPLQTPPPAHARRLPRTETAATTGDLLDSVDMTPLHRCLHIHACLGRLPQFTEYYIQNRRQQLTTDLTLSGDFLEHYQAYLTQLVGYFLVEDAVARTAGWAGAAGAEGHLDIVAQVDAAWDAAVAALKGVLEPAFRGATAAAAMLTVKDFLLLVCLALDHCGYHTVAIKEVMMGSRTKYQELLGAATEAAVQAAVAGDSLATVVEVDSAARAQELFAQLALPPTFRPEDASNKRPPFKAPFTPMVPRLARAIRGHIVDTVAYLKGLLTAGEVVPATRQYRDRMLARIVVDALQKRVDAAAGQADLPVETALQLVANIAAVVHALAPLDDFILAQARGETAETAAAAMAAASSRSPSPGMRGRSRSPGKRMAATEAEPRGRQHMRASSGGDGEQGGRSRDSSPASSHGSAPSPSPPSSPRAAPGGLIPDAQLPASQQPSQQQQQQPAGSQQSSHTVLSLSATGATASSRAAAPATNGASSAAATFAGLLSSAESLVVQAGGGQGGGAAGGWGAAGLVAGRAEAQYRLQREVASVVARMAPAQSMERMLRAVLRYVADAVMLQLLSESIPEYNIFGLQRLYSDLGGVGRAAGSMGVPGLPDELAEPMLFCEMMVFGSLEDLLQPGAGAKHACLNLRRLCLVLEKYRELDKASGFAGLHKKGQAERFISRKTVDRVLQAAGKRPSRGAPANGVRARRLTSTGHQLAAEGGAQAPARKRSREDDAADSEQQEQQGHREQPQRGRRSGPQRGRRREELERFDWEAHDAALVEVEQAMHFQTALQGPDEHALRWAQESGFYSRPFEAVLADGAATPCGPTSGFMSLVDARLVRPNPLQHFLQLFASGVHPMAAGAAALQQIEQWEAQQHVGTLRASVAQAALAWRRDPQRCRDMAALLSQPSYRAAREVPAYTAWIQYVETVAGQASLSDAVLRPAAKENGAWLGGQYFGPNF